jgi:hypothetical protein
MLLEEEIRVSESDASCWLGRQHVQLVATVEDGESADSVFAASEEMTILIDFAVTHRVRRESHFISNHIHHVAFFVDGNLSVVHRSTIPCPAATAGGGTTSSALDRSCDANWGLGAVWRIPVWGTVFGGTTKTAFARDGGATNSMGRCVCRAVKLCDIICGRSSGVVLLFFRFTRRVGRCFIRVLLVGFGLHIRVVVGGVWLFNGRR